MTGAVLSHYQIGEKLGEGGMGVVYKARDTALERFVAIKVLPVERMADAGRKQRFFQEARAASALNHPNIITIHEIVSDNGVDAIIMELVAGKTLDQLIGRKGLKLHDTLRYGIQIADALAAAHAAGIVHRDLKPGNIMVNDAGRVKVLDFGLAKLTEPAPGEQELTRTMKPATEEGAIVGTAAYMSPEQAEGKPVDARSDVFAFGSVLYEMVAGRRAFHGGTKVSILSAILKDEPQPVSAISEEVPRDLEKIVARCLRKDPARRFQHMDDVKIALEELQEESDSGTAMSSAAMRPAVPRKRRSPLLWAAVALGVLLVAAAAIWLRPSNEPPPRMTPLTSYPGREIQPALSPDGKEVAFAWSGEKDDNFDIYVKLVDAGAPLRLTTDPRPDRAPAWSPDGRMIAFIRSDPSGAEVYTIPALGGAERKIAQSAAADDPMIEVYAGAGISWSADGKYLAYDYRASPKDHSAVFLVSVETHEKQRLTQPPAGYAGDFYPKFSPDGKWLAFSRVRARGSVEVLLLPMAGVKPGGAAQRGFAETAESAWYDWMPDSRGVVFSLRRDGAWSLWRTPAFDAAPQRVAFVGDGAVWVSVSHQGRRLVYSKLTSDTNIWRRSGPGAAEPVAPHALIASTQPDEAPCYAPDGKRITFISERSGSREVWVSDAEGKNAVQMTSFGGPPAGSPKGSPDGRWIAFDLLKQGHRDLHVISAEGGAPRKLTNDPSQHVRPSWSQDGRSIYYGGNRSGDWQVWKIPASGGQPVQVTKQGGRESYESPDGQFLYYTKADAGGLWKVPVAGGAETQVLGKEASQGHWCMMNRGVFLYFSYYDFATGRVVPFGERVKGVQYRPGVSVSPDEKWVLYTQLDRQDSDLVLVENFR